MWLFSGCATAHLTKPSASEVRFDPVVVTSDAELQNLNDQELFAKGASAFAAEDFAQAARFFDRLVDFHPDSSLRKKGLFNAGLSHEKQAVTLSAPGQVEERRANFEMAYKRLADLADARRGTGDALDAAFRLAEVLYHLDQYPEAIAILQTLAARSDLSVNKRLEAQVQQGICELEAGNSERAESTLRAALSTYQSLADKDEVDDYFPAQAQFFLGEIYRLHYEAAGITSGSDSDQMTQELEYKSELLLSAQGHYLRAIRLGNGNWATAAGARIGGLYQDLYQHMLSIPAPSELNAEEAEVYRREVKKKIRVLITKAITVYERTLEAAERIGERNLFVEETKQKLQQMKEILLADTDADAENGEEKAPAAPPPSPKKPLRPKSTAVRRPPHQT